MSDSLARAAAAEFAQQVMLCPSRKKDAFNAVAASRTKRRGR